MFCSTTWQDDTTTLSTLRTIEKELTEQLESRPASVIQEFFRMNPKDEHRLDRRSLARVFIPRLVTMAIGEEASEGSHVAISLMATLCQYEEFRACLKGDGRLIYALIQGALDDNKFWPTALYSLIDWEQITEGTLLDTIRSSSLLTDPIIGFGLTFHPLIAEYIRSRQDLVDSVVRRIPGECDSTNLLILYTWLLRIIPSCPQIFNEDNISSLVRIGLSELGHVDPMRGSVAADFFISATEHEDGRGQIIHWIQKGLFCKFIELLAAGNLAKSVTILKLISGILNWLQIYSIPLDFTNMDTFTPLIRHIYGFGAEVYYSIKCLMTISSLKSLSDIEWGNLDTEFLSLLKDPSRILIYDAPSDHDTGTLLMRIAKSRKFNESHPKVIKAFQGSLQDLFERGRMDNVAQTNQSLLSSLIKMRRMLSNSDLAMKVEYEERIEGLKDELKGSQEHLAATNDELVRTRTEMDVLIAKMNHKEEEMMQAIHEIDNLKTSIDQINRVKDDLLAVGDEERLAKELLLQEIHQLRETLDNLRNATTRKDDEIQNLKLEISSLSALSEEHETAATSMRGDLEKLKLCNQAIELEKENLTREFKRRLALERTEKNQSAIQLTEEARQLQRTCADLQSKLEFTALTEIQLRDELERMGKEAEMKDQLITQLKEDMVQLQNELSLDQDSHFLSQLSQRSFVLGEDAPVGVI